MTAHFDKDVRMTGIGEPVIPEGGAPIGWEWLRV